jgi:hypothetical protein
MTRGGNWYDFWTIMAYVFISPVMAYGQSDQIIVDGGLGILNTEGSGLSQVKFAKFGLQEDLWGALKQRFNAGVWLDSRGDGHSSSTFSGYQLGFEVSNEVLQASIFSGPNLISSPDVALGGMFQMNESIFLGIKDSDCNSIGIVYNHFSSAGIEQPNLGKDFLGLEIKFPF